MSILSSRAGRLAIMGSCCMTIACNWGTRPGNFEPARSAEGARVTVRVSGEPSNRLGELFAADSAGIMVYTDEQRLVRIAWPRVDALDVSRLGRDVDIHPGEQPSDEKRQRLALVSRFPQGLRGPLLARTLELLHQDAVQDIK